MIICPFGIYCNQRTNKKGQPSNVCWHFFIDKCTEEKKIYEHSKPLVVGGPRPGLNLVSNQTGAPAHPQEDTEMNETCKICGGRFNSPFNDPNDDICPECRGEWSRNYQEEMSHEPPENEEPDTWSLDEQLHHFNRKVSTEEVKKHD